MVLAWPEFRMPDEAFIANYRHVVPEITELASFGISLSDVKETLRWLHTVQSYSLPEKLTAATASAMVTAVTARLQPPFRSMFAGIELQTKCPVLVDPEDEEAGRNSHGVVCSIETTASGYQLATSFLAVRKRQSTRRKSSRTGNLQL